MTGEMSFLLVRVRVRWCALLGVFLVGSLAGACSAVVDIDVPEEESDGDVEPTWRLLLIGEPERRLVVGGEERFEVLCMDERGAPCVGAMVRFDLLGEVFDSSLQDVSARTDEDGVAATRLLAGQRAARFRLRARIARAAEVWFDVEVEAEGEGTVEVVLEPYRGVRRLDRIVVQLLPGSRCEGGAPPLFEGILPPVGGRLRWTGVPADVPLHLEAEGEGRGGAVSSRACLESLVVAPGRGQEVRLALVDRPAPWDLSEGALSVRAPGIPEMLARWAYPALERVWASWGGIGVALTSRVVDALRAAGEGAAADRLQRARETASFDASLASAWQEAGGAPLVLEALTAALEPLSSLEASLEAPRFDPDLGEASVRLVSTWGADGESLGGRDDAWLLRVWVASPSASGYEEVRVEVDLPLGTLAWRRLTRSEAVLDVFSEAFGCGGLAAWAVARPEVPPEADESLWMASCRGLLADAIEGTVGAWEAADRRWSVLRMRGGLVAERSERGSVDTVDVVVREGSWGDAGSSGSGSRGGPTVSGRMALR